MLKTYTIYKLTDKNNNHYIGRTTNFTKRKYDHLNRFKNTGRRNTSRVNLMDHETLKIEILCKYTTDLEYQAEIIEQTYIDLYKSFLGGLVVNKNRTYSPKNICEICTSSYGSRHRCKTGF